MTAAQNFSKSIAKQIGGRAGQSHQFWHPAWLHDNAAWTFGERRF